MEFIFIFFLQIYYPRTATFKRLRAEEELPRMIAAAKAKGLGPESVDSIYLKGEEAMREHERRNGYDRPHGPGGLQFQLKEDPAGKAYEMEEAIKKGTSLDVIQEIRQQA